MVLFPLFEKTTWAKFWDERCIFRGEKASRKIDGNFPLNPWFSPQMVVDRKGKGIPPKVPDDYGKFRVFIVELWNKKTKTIQSVSKKLRSEGWSLKSAGFFCVFVGPGLSTRRSSDWAEVCLETNLQARCDWQMTNSQALTLKKNGKKTPWFEVAGSFSSFLRLKKTDCFFVVFGENCWFNFLGMGRKFLEEDVLLFLKVVFSWKDHNWIYVQ